MTLRMLAERIEQLTGQINELNRRLTRLVERHAPQLLAPVGMCSDSAVALLMTMGDNPERLSTEASFAALCGVSPIACSSGWRSTHRLNYGGDHRANAALHRVVFTRLRVDPRTPGVLTSILRDGPPTESADRFAFCEGSRAGRWPECRLGWAPGSTAPGWVLFS
ncbi:transposase [Streptomyces albogriseolus]|uniref:transposase n=1 Tax=Streptomyces albogriseolus TaxID=1887 RepID=UPI003CF904C1